jgi:hypothetical protein
VDEMFHNVADIFPGREDAHIKVTVLRLWKVPAFLNPIETSSTEMKLVDEKVSVFSLLNFICADCVLFIVYISFRFGV